MPRHKEFDTDAALDRAMETFWAKGYEATSVQDLVERMGIHRGSLYGTFGDKHRLFLAALKRYDRSVARCLLDILERQGSGKQAIRDFFRAKIGYALAADRPAGCLVTNSAVECAAHDRQAAARVAASLARMERAFYKALLRARQGREIAPGRNLRALASYLTMCAQGLTVVGKVRPRRAALRQIVTVALAALD
ncbi:MAG TPA: TetR/AcrR family transcriptional regulator [Candidatus Sulfotelmatobacter sp.]|nr:TetR/AcrR family transcriptional regulator [Candidatus Sulfotelmatobacter sp.]